MACPEEEEEVDLSVDGIRDNIYESVLNGTSFLDRSLEYYSGNNETLSAPPGGENDELKFNDINLMSVIVLCILCVVASVGNLTVFWTLWRHRRCRSRVNLFIMHLSVADLFVALIMMPLEIVWHVTVAWLAGDFLCRLMMFFRAFGLYLSSFILIAISLDRYFAVARPLNLQTADKRGKVMIAFAWIFSVISSSPQSVIFHVEQHPDYRWFYQCVTFKFFPTKNHELAYNLFNLIAVYLLPLVVIIFSYSMILCVISRKARQNKEMAQKNFVMTNMRVRTRSFRLRSSSRTIIERAKSRTLKMTIVIVTVFIICWTPYFVISAWWWFDCNSASKINQKVQKGLFLFAVSSSCVDPIVYGMFSTVFRRSMQVRCQRLRSLIRPTKSQNIVRQFYQK